MQRTGSGLKTQKSQKRTKGLRSHSNLEEVHGNCCERCFDYIITGDFSGLYRGAKNGIVTFVNNLSERHQNFQKWFALKRKEQEQRATDKTIEHPYPRIRTIVHTNCFEIIGNMVIFANTFVVGWQAELLPHTVTDRDKLVSTILENFFTFAFVVELLLSTLCWGWTSLLERENWMDVFLVFLGVLTTWILGPFGIEVDFLRKLTALRTLRLIRLARAVLATTLRYFMGQSVEAGTFTETALSGDALHLHDAVLALSDEDLVKATAAIDAALRNARSVIETREALQAISEAEGEIQGIEDEDWKNFPLETEDMSKMEDVE